MRRFKMLNIILILLLAAVCLAAFLAGCGGRKEGEESGNKNGTIPETGETSNKEKAHFKFIVCGDPQNNYEVFRKVIAAANTVDFLIIAGDLTGSGTQTEVQNFLSEIQACKVPYYAVPGNHDVAVSPVSVSFTPYFGQVPRSFDHGNSHFVLIDNSTPSLGFYPEEQEWVKADLAQASGRGYEHIFAVCHVPPGYPYSARTTPEDRVGIRANRELVPILTSGGVDELFCGHYHSDREYEEDGLIITITGGAGAEPFGTSSFYHYVLVEINGKKRSQEVVKI